MAGAPLARPVSRISDEENSEAAGALLGKHGSSQGSAGQQCCTGGPAGGAATESKGAALGPDGNPPIQLIL